MRHGGSRYESRAHNYPSAPARGPGKCPKAARANVHTQFGNKTHPARTEGSRAGPSRRRTPRIVAQLGRLRGITLAPPLAVSAQLRSVSRAPELRGAARDRRTYPSQRPDPTKTRAGSRPRRGEGAKPSSPSPKRRPRGAARRRARTAPRAAPRTPPPRRRAPGAAQRPARPPPLRKHTTHQPTPRPAPDAGPHKDGLVREALRQGLLRLGAAKEEQAKALRQNVRSRRPVVLWCLHAIDATRSIRRALGVFFDF